MRTIGDDQDRGEDRGEVQGVEISEGFGVGREAAGA